MTWVTLEEVKHHLRYDDDSNDTMLTLYLKSAETSVKNYITDEFTDSVPDDVKAAILLLVGFHDDNRTVTPNTVTNGCYLPAPVIALLTPYRKPTAI